MVQTANNQYTRRILITRFSAVGDIAMTIPIVYSLAKEYPNYQFIFASRERFDRFFVNAPANILFAGINLDSHKGLSGLNRLYNKLKSYNPNSYVDLHNVLRTKYLQLRFRLAGVPVAQIKKGHSEKKGLTRRNNKTNSELTPMFERYANAFKELGLPFKYDFTSLLSCEDLDNHSIHLDGHEICKNSDKWIGIAPFARHKGKIYPIEKMSEVVSILAKEPNLRIFCFGNGAREAEVANNWAKKYSNVHSFINKSDFHGELILMSKLNVMLSMDSANMHIASLVNTSVASIWGATSPLAGFLGWKQKREDCIELSLQCRPCSVFGDTPCYKNDYACMNIQPQRIADHTLKMIGKN